MNSGSSQASDSVNKNSSMLLGFLLIQISPKNVIYILRSLLSFVNNKV